MKNFTTFTTKENAEKNRSWFEIDATGLPLGKLASEIAVLLRGKHKPSYTPHVDDGDHVVVTNAAQVRLSGNKKKGKIYQWHTGYIGGLMERTAGEMMDRNPAKVVELAVKRMLPRGPLGRQQYGKLNVYSGAEHPHAGQKPVAYQLKSLKNQ